MLSLTIQVSFDHFGKCMNFTRVGSGPDFVSTVFNFNRHLIGQVKKKWRCARLPLHNSDLIMFCVELVVSKDQNTASWLNRSVEQLPRAPKSTFSFFRKSQPLSRTWLKQCSAPVQYPEKLLKPLRVVAVQVDIRWSIGLHTCGWAGRRTCRSPGAICPPCGCCSPG